MTSTRSPVLSAHYSPEKVRKNVFVRELFQMAEVGAAIGQVAETMLGEFLENKFGYSRAAIAEIVDEMRTQAADKIELGPADLVEILRREVISTLEGRASRIQHEERKAQAKALAPQGPKSAIQKKRKNEQRVIFADRTVTSKLGAVLVGSPEFVERAIAGVLKKAAEKSYRTIRFFDRPAHPSDAGFHNGDLGISLFSPKWDAVLGGFGRLRQEAIGAAERKLSAPADLMLVDDLGYRPVHINAVNSLLSFFTRAAKIYRGIEHPAQTSGAGVVAGMKIKAGVQYDGQGLVRIGDLGQRYDLFEEDGKLFGIDNYGYKYLIEE